MRLFGSELIGGDNLVDVLGKEVILALALLEVLGPFDEWQVVRLLAPLQHQDAQRNAGRKE